MLIVAALLTVITLASPASSTVYDYGYDKDTISVKRGQKIVWHFDQSNSQAHTVTYDKGPKGSKPFNSGDKVAGETFSKKLKVKGSYTLYCVHHGGMEQKVKVR